MSDSGEAPDLSQWLRTRAAVESIALHEDDIPDLARRMAAAHVSLARLYRHDLTDLDYAVQHSATRQPT